MKSSTHYFYVTMKILINFPICISVPLKFTRKWNQKNASADRETDFTIFTSNDADIIRNLFAKLNPLCFKHMLTYFKALHKWMLLLIPNTMVILKLLFTNPATSVTAERSFLLTSRVKTWLKSTSSAKQFNSTFFTIIKHSPKILSDRCC